MPQGSLNAQSPHSLIQRAATLQVGDLSIPAGQGVGLDITFTVRRGLHITQGSLKPQPNTCDLKIWGLNPDHRKRLAQSTATGPGDKPKTVPCVLTAGYVGSSAVIFSGQLRSANNVTEGANKVTEMTTGDGDQALMQTRMNIAIAAGSDAGKFLDTVLSALGVSAENLPAAKQLVSGSPAAGQLFAKGTVLKGSAAEIMTDFTMSCGLEWSIQSGKLRILPLGGTDSNTGILIADDPNTGLIGSPTVDIKGILSFDVEMIPNLVPGCKVKLDTEEVKGIWRVIGTTTTGSTFENDWKIAAECQRLAV